MITTTNQAHTSQLNQNITTAISSTEYNTWDRYPDTTSRVHNLEKIIQHQTIIAKKPTSSLLNNYIGHNRHHKKELNPLKHLLHQVNAPHHHGPCERQPTLALTAGYEHSRMPALSSTHDYHERTHSALDKYHKSHLMHTCICIKIGTINKVNKEKNSTLCVLVKSMK